MQNTLLDTPISRGWFGLCRELYDADMVIQLYAIMNLLKSQGKTTFPSDILSLIIDQCCRVNRLDSKKKPHGIWRGWDFANMAHFSFPEHMSIPRYIGDRRILETRFEHGKLRSVRISSKWSRYINHSDGVNWPSVPIHEKFFSLECKGNKAELIRVYTNDTVLLRFRTQLTSKFCTYYKEKIKILKLDYVDHFAHWFIFNENGVFKQYEFRKIDGMGWCDLKNYSV